MLALEDSIEEADQELLVQLSAEDSFEAEIGQRIDIFFSEAFHIIDIIA